MNLTGLGQDNLWHDDEDLGSWEAVNILATRVAINNVSF
jgi:hypothetical protein